MALENEMCLVSMAANETVLCIHVRKFRHNDVEDRQKHGRERSGRKMGCKTILYWPQFPWQLNVSISLLSICQIVVWGNRKSGGLLFKIHVITKSKYTNTVVRDCKILSGR